MHRRHRSRNDKMKITLVTLWSVALALGILTFIVIFYPPGASGPVASPISASSSINFASSSASSTATSTASSTALATTTGTSSLPTATSTVVATTPGQFASEYSAPYPANWQEGGEQFSVTGASFQGNQLTLTLAIQMGAAAECVPVNIRLVADEAGTLRAPSAPAGGAFTFPDTQNCDGTPGELYSVSAVFDTSGVPSPFLLTSGGSANTYFFAATTTAGGVNITLPATQG